MYESLTSGLAIKEHWICVNRKNGYTLLGMWLTYGDAICGGARCATHEIEKLDAFKNEGWEAVQALIIYKKPE